MTGEQRGDLSYRPDIDGLRALAVMAVALYHAEIPGFSGGFVGVDIFFVISGYLITRIIAAGARRGDFSFLDFYERRARRLLPALFLVATAVTLFTLAYKSPRDTAIFGESVSLFAVFAANFFFYDQLDYFADPAAFYPLLHTWSLAVEEQFYLIWPPLLLLLWRWRPERVFAALAALAALSLAASVVAVAYDPQLAFFHTPFRLWQLGAGGLLALAPPVFAGGRGQRARRDGAAALGLALMVGSIAFYSDQTPFPGLAAIPPTLGAALVIAAGAGGEAGRVGALLSARPAVFVGLCSYSFYLWHWPALSAARYLSFEPLSIAQSIGVLVVAFLLAALTWAYVERPFRGAGQVLGRQGVFACAGAGIAAFLLFGWAVQETNGLPGRFPALAPLFTEDARRYGPAPASCAPLPGRRRGEIADDLLDGVDPRSCALRQAAEGRPVVALAGDSHAWALAPGLALWAEQADVTLYVLWSPTCPPFIGADRPVKTRFFDCARHNAAMPDVAKALGARHVLLAAQWSRYEPRLDLAAGITATAKALRDRGVEPVLIAEVPAQLGHTPTLVFRARSLDRPYPLARDRETLEVPLRAARDAVAQGAAAAKLRLLDPGDHLCPDGDCAVMSEDGATLYADSHHLNRIGARRIGAALGRRSGVSDLER